MTSAITLAENSERPRTRARQPREDEAVEEFLFRSLANPSRRPVCGRAKVFVE
ncbi:hypothetical protein [Candidatus Mycobacterium methanotrophicum]|uniref:Uncharacterized protein n=1 Tax=Candidatus Mycobacterium methanotrophicum TaxID=2943498 RepID=A0ABY4QNZ1_9MYCO|nr:hypothetical protein [Candidatus Mycobacterium methanotrophicum]UQX11499.1 hypothetical protein M5I08_03015 [Candidatus Mycobacterium methanotrophicum]